MKEREISLLELLIEAMLHWRAILIWMAVGAVLAGGFGYIRSNRAPEATGTGTHVQEAGQDASEAQSALEEKLTDSQLQNVNYVVAYEAVLRDRLAYQEKSLIMRMDPNCVQRADLTFYVEADDWRRACDIEKVYENIVQSGEFGAYLAGQIGEENAGSIGELVSLAQGSNSIVEGTDSFSVSLVHYDRAVLRDMAGAAIRFIDKKHGQIEEAMGKHEAIVLNQSEAEAVDMDILDRQKNIIDGIASMEISILQYKDAFTAEEQQYYDFLAEQSDGNGVDGPGDKAQELAGSAGAASPGIGSSVKYAVLGMFLAAFLYVFFFFMRYVFDNKLHASDSLQELYGIAQLGLIPQPESRKLFGFIDQWLLSARDSGGRRFPEDEAMRLAVAAVKMAAAKEGTGKICLVGCGLSGRSLEICGMVRDSLAKDGIRADILNNVLYDAQAMRSLEGAGAAVLVERAHYTLYSEIAKEAELLRRQGITVLGGIVAA